MWNKKDFNGRDGTELKLEGAVYIIREREGKHILNKGSNTCKNYLIGMA